MNKMMEYRQRGKSMSPLQRTKQRRVIEREFFKVVPRETIAHWEKDTQDLVWVSFCRGWLSRENSARLETKK